MIYVDASRRPPRQGKDNTATQARQITTLRSPFSADLRVVPECISFAIEKPGFYSITG
ncbi:MAG: hypothetical protein AB4352_25805 [Hormoscilla sp.]